MLAKDRLRFRRDAVFFARLAIFPLLTIAALPTAECGGEISQLAAIAVAEVSLPEPLTDIGLLGSNEFRTRQSAGNRLLEQPVLAHDWLYRAQYSSDPEIAHSARRLLGVVEDRLFSGLVPDYRSPRDDGTIADAEKTILRISQLPPRESTATLLAIVRFEPCNTLAFRALAELVNMSEHAGFIGENDLRALGQSPRVAAQWLGIWYQNPFSSEDFSRHSGRLMEHVLASYSTESDVLPDHIVDCLRATESRSRQLGMDDFADEICRRLAAYIHARPVEMIEMYDWLLSERAETILDELNCECFQLIREDARLLCRQSEYFRLQGRTALADQCIEQATSMTAGKPGGCIELALHLQSCGHERLAMEILSRTSKKNDGFDASDLMASRLLARILHDRNDELAAALVLESSIDRFRQSTRLATRSTELARDEALVELACYRHRYHVTNGEDDLALKHLADGLQLAPDNSELLIAAWRYHHGSPDWSETVEELIEISLARLEQQIHHGQLTRPNDSRDRHSHQYELRAAMNSYAWLASSTNRHLETASKYARIAAADSADSVELMDTLACCLAARGQFREAIEWQRRALASAPHDQRLQANLARFQESVARLESTATIR
jgi:tetratricopeptide (TPR) repeat protein